eukprot:TRINITY_DN488_c0_g2_i1.p2 TRINITY_DN488_c0_g2~~TRINITY_DN488_c0_g2_i1.p2  ORF type:complete len:465 (+),score=98.21 TRINITY_DN488_c0_g2_i1:3-1397(+)
MDDVLAKHELYSMMIQQLQADGYDTVAQQLKLQSGDVSLNTGPSGQLFDKFKSNIKDKPTIVKAFGPGLNLEAPVPPAELQVEFVQKASLAQSSNVSCFAFANDGNLFAVGMQSGKIVVYTTDAVAFQSDMITSTQGVLQTIGDQSSAINALSFHPSLPLLVSAAQDNSIRVYKLDGSGTTQCLRRIEEACPVNSISFHPSGYFLAVACEHITPRLYNAETWQCYRPSAVEDEHTGPVVKVEFSSDGSQLITCCRAGCVKLWSVVSFRCLRTYDNLFEHAPAVAVQFSSNNHYALVTGATGKLVLLDLDKGRQVATYQAEDTTNVTCAAVFGANDDVIIWSNAEGSVVVWNTRLQQQANVDSSYATPLSTLCYNNAQRVLLTAGADRTVRCWVHPGSNIVKVKTEQTSPQESVKPAEANVIPMITTDQENVKQEPEDGSMPSAMATAPDTATTPATDVKAEPTA